MLRYFDGKDVFIRDNYVCADENYRLNVRTVTEYRGVTCLPIICFIPQADDSFEPDWTILCAPEFYADPAVDGTRQHNFSIVDFTRRKC